MDLSIILVVVTMLIAMYLIRQQRRRAKLPPGPPGLPLIGNLHQAPKGAPWLMYQKWIEQYGNIVSVNFGGTTIVIIGDYETAKNLLDKRGSIYSDRPRMVSSTITFEGVNKWLTPVGHGTRAGLPQQSDYLQTVRR
jgi:hypothetical protein